MFSKYINVIFFIALLGVSESICAAGIDSCKNDCKAAIGGNVYADASYRAYLNCERQCEQNFSNKSAAGQHVIDHFISGFTGFGGGS